MVRTPAVAVSQRTKRSFVEMRADAVIAAYTRHTKPFRWRPWPKPATQKAGRL